MAYFLFNGPILANDVSLSFMASAFSRITLECAVIASAGQPAAAVIVVEGSNTGNDWVPVVQLTTTGITRQIDGGIAETHWNFLRARVVSASPSVQCILSMITAGFPYGA